MLAEAFGDNISAVLKLVPMALPAQVRASIDMLLTHDDYESLRANHKTTEAEPLDLPPTGASYEGNETSCLTADTTVMGVLVNVENVNRHVLVPPLSSPGFWEIQDERQDVEEFL